MQTGLQASIQPYLTGVSRLDLALGTPGLPPGEIVEINGPEGCGKTALCLSLVAANQSRGPSLFVDADHILTAQYALRHGVDPWQMFVAGPQTAAEGFDIIEAVLRTGACPLVIVDSYTALITPGPLGGDRSPSEQEEQSRLASTALRRISMAARQSGALVVFTSLPTGGPASVYHGLRSDQAWLALKLHAGLRLILAEPQPVYQGGLVIGQSVQVRPSGRLWTRSISPIALDFMYNGCIN